MEASGKTILVVDDDKHIVGLLTEILIYLGHKVLSAGNGEDALKLLKNHTPHLIILDMNMPKMGGISFFHAIADKLEGKARYPVLVMTGRGELSSVFEDLHVDGFMTKPFEIAALQEKVTEILKARYGASDARRPVREGAKKIVIVEDDNESFGVIEAEFAQRNVEIRRVRDCVELPALLKSFSADLVLFKAAEPNLQGNELIMASRVKKLLWPKVIPVVMFSYRKVTVSPEDLEQLILSSGVYAVLSEAQPADMREAADRIFSEDAGYRDAQG